MEEMIQAKTMLTSNKLSLLQLWAYKILETLVPTGF
jgi:hypothetical protein